MRNHTIRILIFGHLLFAGLRGATQTVTDQQKFESLYDLWHKALDANPFLAEPMFFRTNTPDKNLTGVVQEIMSNKIALAYFLCEKVARAQYSAPRADPNSRWYRDVLLLNEISGIDLFFPDDKPNVIGTNYWPKLMAKFQEEWRAGVYNDPTRQIKVLCEARLSREADENINPRALSAIRRYGIFGLPELVRQIKKNNSKHAFAAYLIITRQPREYSSYIQHSNQQFTNKEAKLDHVRDKVEKLKASGGGDFDIMKKIAAALAE